MARRRGQGGVVKFWSIYEKFRENSLNRCNLSIRVRFCSMGEMITFSRASGGSAHGYLAVPASGTGPGVVVIQEWWGLIDQIKSVCDRLADRGFVALAPDLYDGRVVPLEEPDEAAKTMMALQLSDAAADLSGAVDVLLDRSTSNQVGVLGFCMGGGLALVLGALRPDAVAAVVPCYGVHPWPEGHPDYANYSSATQIHSAGLDDFFTPDAASALKATLEGRQVDVELFVYPDSQHAFFNDDRPDVFDAKAAGLLWERSVVFLHQHVG